VTWQFQPPLRPSRFVVSNCVSKIGVAWSPSDIGTCPGGPTYGGRAAKVKPAADAGPTAS